MGGGGGGRRSRAGRRLDSLRRASACGADAISPCRSSRSIEVHGRKQAPFYPVHSRQRERWTDGARCTAGRGGRASALLSRAVSRRLSCSRALSLSLFSFSLSPSRATRHRRESRRVRSPKRCPARRSCLAARVVFFPRRSPLGLSFFLAVPFSLSPSLSSGFCSVSVSRDAS
ncbi:hypothetical protein PUN28_001106 [Cardiocondyla obscurior]|uniref:Uncharacterized protein n=1 Tax=Cardiocondyla obscurior TaxID=286306 RepID=A0AAW2H2X4_9HYME